MKTKYIKKEIYLHHGVSGCFPETVESSEYYIYAPWLYRGIWEGNRYWGWKGFFLKQKTIIDYTYKPEK